MRSSPAVSFLLLAGTLAPLGLEGRNPIVPEGTCFADPSAKVWSDGRLYLYGSTDEVPDRYCSHRHDVFSTSDMVEWRVDQNVFASKGGQDAVPYNDRPLFAPDCAERDGRYWLYYCQGDPTAHQGVAWSDSPTGPFHAARKLDLAEYDQIDPGVFIDEDGQAYLVWGQFSATIARLHSSMNEIDMASVRGGVITEAEHKFHEGPFLTKRNGVYYLVYAHMGRGNVPSALGYATATSPIGPYTYRGVIIDNTYSDPANWNNHGSIAAYQGQWYVFYHRTTHNSRSMRKACVEPIQFNADGSISEVEMTSQGAGPPLPADQTTEARLACLLFGHVRVNTLGERHEGLTHFGPGDRVAYKYLDFGTGCDRVGLRVRPGVTAINLTLRIDQPWGKELTTVSIPAGSEAQDWIDVSTDIAHVKDVHALWIEASAAAKDPIPGTLALDTFVFSSSRQK